MEQHPIPQQISSYQFRLVGDMTLKQFFQLAGGFLVALLFYSTPLIGIVKWPFVIVSATLGVALAFLPLEERPLERWIFAFFKAIYAPTEFFWAKTATPAKFFQDETGPVEEVPALKTPLSKLDVNEQGFLSTLTGLFNTAVNTVMPQAVTSPTTPVVTPEKPKEVPIPQTAPIKVVTAPTHLVVEERKPEPVFSGPQITTHAVTPIVAGNEIISTSQAMFSVDAAPPNPPTVPNTVVGQVVDADRRIIEGAIMEIRDAMGRPIRALRSNKVGHFVTVTPLETGRYDIVTEKDGYQFTPVSFEATGNLIPPILVQGRKVIQ